jgi:hypothetical protein
MISDRYRLLIATNGEGKWQPAVSPSSTASGWRNSPLNGA